MLIKTIASLFCFPYSAFPILFLLILFLLHRFSPTKKQKWEKTELGIPEFEKLELKKHNTDLPIKTN